MTKYSCPYRRRSVSRSSSSSPGSSSRTSIAGSVIAASLPLPNRRRGCRVPAEPFLVPQPPTAARKPQTLLVTCGRVAVAWLLDRSPVVLPIPGTGSLEHLLENLNAALIELSEKDLLALERDGTQPIGPAVWTPSAFLVATAAVR